MTNYEHLLKSNVKAELARRNFKDFVPYVYQGYDMQWFHSHLCDKLQAFIRGDIKKLLVCMPPQHGKSQLTTRLFPAYLLGKNPNFKIVVASYSSTMATSFNRDIQRVIDEDKYRSIFSDTRLSGENVVTRSGSYLRNSEIFEIVNHRGFLKTVGRGGGLTGTPIDIGIIDDPIKDRSEAMSPTIREGLWSWYQDVFETRLHNDSQQLIILTRWHEQDLAGKVLARDGDQWEQVIFEGIKETDNPYDPREMGQALWPNKHSLERILAIKDNSPLTFNSLYQQTPRPLEGQGLFWTVADIERARGEYPLKSFDRVVVSIDPAVTSSAGSDETGIIGVGLLDGVGYILEDESGRYSPNEWANVAISMSKRLRANCIVAEKNQGGEMVESVLRSAGYQERVKMVTASKGKATRAEPVYGLYERGMIKHCKPLHKLEAQMVTFHPDMAGSPDRVDALVWATHELMLSMPTGLFIGSV
jgi:phage terminase large subunit-like protein